MQSNINISKKPLYNLNLVVNETGVKADTIRAWERRYKLPLPARTPGGHRLFSAYDIATIQWLSGKQNEGMSISRAVKLWEDIRAKNQDPLILAGKHIELNLSLPDCAPYLSFSLFNAD